MPPKVRELKEERRKAGFAMRPGKGSHTVWRHPLLPSDKVTVSGNDSQDAKPYQEKQVREALSKLRDIQGR